MKRKTTDQNKPYGKMIRIQDFLPPPQDLVVPEETVKVTISLKKSSITFFKHQAGKYHTKYQRMIREVLDKYAMQYA
jgi:predicted DNA binding CopG/RHH family protein